MSPARTKNLKILRNSMAEKRIQQRSKHKGGNYSEDRISLLPDDIIILILSFLSLKDSVVTSILSRRWRHMWVFTSRLEFVAKDWKPRNEAYNVEKRCNRFVKGVNQVLRLHKLSILEEFSVSCDLDENFSRKIDNWLKFALAKRVQRLKLDFHLPWEWDATRFLDLHSKHYKLSYGMLGDQTNGTSVGFESLKVLCLNRVHVTGEVLEGFLSNCPSLEKLSVTKSVGLVSFKVHDPSLVLKYLEISYCDKLTSVEICNINLVTLIYRGRKIRWILQDAPMLIELTIGCPAYLSLNELFIWFSCCLPQLETLTLEIRDKEIELFNVPLELSNLKKLVLKSCLPGDISFLGYTPLIKASPRLQRFVSQARWSRTSRLSPLLSIRKKEIRRVEKFQHQHIEEVELCGYYGWSSDLELLTFFLENAVSLKKIIVDPRSYPIEEEIEVKGNLRREKAAKQRILQQLDGKIPQGIEIKIL